jgi:hypothetical protein
MIMNATIVLLIYGSIALGLICGGIIALLKGFKLIMKGRGKKSEKNSIEFVGLKVRLSSIGSLVMITAFMWGWAAVKALPDYKDQLVEIHTAKLNLELNKSINEIALLEKEHPNIINNNTNLKEILSNATSNLNESRLALDYGDRKNIDFNNVVASISQQQNAYMELEKAVKQGDNAKINVESLKLEEATKAVKRVFNRMF